MYLVETKSDNPNTLNTIHKSSKSARLADNSYRGLRLIRFVFARQEISQLLITCLTLTFSHLQSENSLSRTTLLITIAHINSVVKHCLIDISLS